MLRIGKTTFIWQKACRAHVVNPTGHVERKIRNERQLIKVLRQRKKYFDVSGYELDKIDMSTQVKIFRRVAWSRFNTWCLSTKVLILQNFCQNYFGYTGYARHLE